MLPNCCKCYVDVDAFIVLVLLRRGDVNVDVFYIGVDIGIGGGITILMFGLVWCVIEVDVGC